MSFEAKRNTPLPLWKARRCGVVIMPLPCYASHGKLDSRYHRYLCLILANNLADGVWFGPAWGSGMWVFTWKDEGMQPGAAFVLSIVAGICFGVLMAASLVAKGS